MGGNSTPQLCPVTTAQNVVTKEARHHLAYTPVYFCTMKGSGHAYFSVISLNASRWLGSGFCSLHILSWSCYFTIFQFIIFQLLLLSYVVTVLQHMTSYSIYCSFYCFHLMSQSLTGDWPGVWGVWVNWVGQDHKMSLFIRTWPGGSLSRLCDALPNAF